jgi:hypothetical protein
MNWRLFSPRYLEMIQVIFTPLVLRMEYSRARIAGHFCTCYIHLFAGRFLPRHQGFPLHESHRWQGMFGDGSGVEVRLFCIGNSGRNDLSEATEFRASNHRHSDATAMEFLTIGRSILPGITDCFFFMP